MSTDWTTPPNGNEAGTTVSLDNDPRWALLGMAGHGAPDSTVLTAGSPDRDERLPLHAAAQPRLLQLTLRIHGPDLAAYEANRAALAAAFAPWRDAGLRSRPGLLTLTLADGRRRALRAYLRQGLAWAPGGQRGTRAVDSVLLEAPDPFWFDPTAATGSAVVQGPGNLRFDSEAELGFPAAFGPDSPAAVVALTNPGSVRSFPRFTIPGPTTNPAIRLLGTGAAVILQLVVPTGLTLRLTLGAQPDGSLDAPQAVLIDDLGGESNILGALQPGSRFWAFAPGANTVAFTQDAPAAGTTFTYEFFSREVAV